MDLAALISTAEGIRAERGGRSDTVVSDAPVGAFIVPAADVAAIGHGDTLTGAEILQTLFPDQTPAEHPRTQVRTSRGEFQLAPQVAAALGEQGVRQLIEMLKPKGQPA